MKMKMVIFGGLLHLGERAWEIQGLGEDFCCSLNKSFRERARESFGSLLNADFWLSRLRAGPFSLDAWGGQGPQGGGEVGGEVNPRGRGPLSFPAPHDNR